MTHPQILLFNTLSRKKEIFTPLHGDTVLLYSCGPTVYHYVHLGNLRAYIVTDTVRRILMKADYEVKAIINITDVGHTVTDSDDGEDKLEKGARREGKSAYEVARYYEEAFKSDLTALNIPLASYVFPRATESIQEQIEMVQILLEKGYAYMIDNDGVYFDTETYEKYGELAKLDIKGLKSGARVYENEKKRNITDFALWKLSKTDEGSKKREMEWNSPWGVGFPGWHIECSAMSKMYLGDELDIHMGGIDHIPVHHSNERAQSECANGKTYVKYWVHYNFLNDNTGKMAKSNGDFLRLQSVYDMHISPLAYRYYILTAHYRSEMQYSDEALIGSAKRYETLKKFAVAMKGSNGIVIEKYMKAFDEAIYDDMNTSEAIAMLSHMLGDDREKDEDTYATLLAMDEVLGLDLKNAEEEKMEITKEVEEILEKRKEARVQKDFAESDRLRDILKSMGYEVLDGKDRQEVKKC